MRITWLVTISAALGLAACAHDGGTVVDPTKVSSFQKGTTTRAQVISTLGPPSGSSVNSDGTTSIRYSHFDQKVNAATYIPIVGLFAGGASTDTQTCVFRFDATDHYLDGSCTQNTTKVHMPGVG